MREAYEKIRAVMLGHAVGDALGVPVEFCEREELAECPVTDMRGFGTYPYPAGCWSDDTSMSLAALDSLASGRLGFDDVMEKFGAWYYEDAYTPTGEMFDVGNTSSAAIENYFIGRMTVEECGLRTERSNGNGSLMRIHPFVLATWYNHRLGSNREWVIERASALTHAHECSILGCKIFALVLMGLLDSAEYGSVRSALAEAKKRYSMSPEVGRYERLLCGNVEELPVEEIKSTGYIVDTLEAAIWCLMTTKDYKSCVLRAVNLGDDTDTVAAVAGALAGALYGTEGIPEEWLSSLKRRSYIESLCLRASLLADFRV